MGNLSWCIMCFLCSLLAYMIGFIHGDNIGRDSRYDKFGGKK